MTYYEKTHKISKTFPSVVFYGDLIARISPSLMSIRRGNCQTGYVIAVQNSNTHVATDESQEVLKEVLEYASVFDLLNI